MQNEVAIFAMQFSGVSHALAATAMRTSYFGSGYARKMQNSLSPAFGRRDLNLMPGWIESRALLVDVGIDVRLRHRGAAALLRRRGRAAARKPPRGDDLRGPTLARMAGVREAVATEGNALEEIVEEPSPAATRSRRNGWTGVKRGGGAEAEGPERRERADRRSEADGPDIG